MARSSLRMRTFVRDDDIELEVRFAYSPGTPERGRHGPPEDYDPGSGPEIAVMHATLVDGDPLARIPMTEDEIERFEAETAEDGDFMEDEDERPGRG